MYKYINTKQRRNPKFIMFDTKIVNEKMIVNTIANNSTKK